MVAVSDNATMNLLIRRVGLGRVNVLAGELGLRRTAPPVSGALRVLCGFYAGTDGG
jgi:beta-lactamase class A